MKKILALGLSLVSISACSNNTQDGAAPGQAVAASVADDRGEEPEACGKLISSRRGDLGEVPVALLNPEQGDLFLFDADQSAMRAFQVFGNTFTDELCLNSTWKRDGAVWVSERPLTSNDISRKAKWQVSEQEADVEETTWRRQSKTNGGGLVPNKTAPR